jgi:hypothetical protein
MRRAKIVWNEKTLALLTDPDENDAGYSDGLRASPTAKNVPT